jgi:DNA polymerase III alpha subunit (gram-positive type)
MKKANPNTKEKVDKMSNLELMNELVQRGFEFNKVVMMTRKKLTDYVYTILRAPEEE